MNRVLVVLLLAAGFASAAVEWRVAERAEGTTRLFSPRARNTGKAPEALGRLLVAEHVVPLRSDAVALIMTGWQGPSGVERIPSEKPLISKVLTQLFDGRSAWHAGFLTFDRINTEHEVLWDRARNAVVVRSFCDFDGYRLPPGAEIAGEVLRIDAGADPFAALERWADAAASRYQPRIWPNTPAGWVGWSWVDGFHVERYEDVVRRNASAIRSKLPGFDIRYIWVSLGNLEGRLPGNWLNWNRSLFPSGPQKLVADLGRLDFRLGLWSGAFWLNSSLTKEVARLGPALLKQHGEPIRVPSSQWGDSFVLDPTHPLTKDFLTNVFRTYREWGVRYYMIDFLDSIGGSIFGKYRPDGFHDATLVPGPQTFREGLRMIRDAAGPDTYLLSSTGPTLHGIGLVDAARVGNDYGEGRPLDGPGKGFFPATFVINGPRHWTSHLRATSAWATHYFVHRRLFLADSGNVLTVDRPISRADAEIAATIFGLNGGPLMLGDDIDRIDPARLELIRLQFPRMPECARPIDLFTSPAPDYPKMFHLRVRRDWDSWDLLAIFNYEEAPLTRTIPFESLGLDGGEAYRVWDFWDSRSLGSRRRELKVIIPPQSVKLFRISHERKHPWLLSTDMHMRQGQAEIEACRWDESKKTLIIRARRPAGNHGSVYVIVPAGMAVAKPAGLFLGKDAADGTLVIRCPFEFASGAAVEKQIEF